MNLLGRLGMFMPLWILVKTFDKACAEESIRLVNCSLRKLCKPTSSRARGQSLAS